MIIEQNITLNDKNWFRTGGPARYYCRPTTKNDFQQALDFATINNLALFVLGSGANLVVHDQGFDGLIIHPYNTTIVHQHQSDHESWVTAGAGTCMNNLITYCLNHNLIGLEEFSGIPGTIGGSIFINIHYFQFLLSTFLVSAHVINIKTGSVEKVSKEWFNFGYNYSTLHEKKHILIDATFSLKRCSDTEKFYALGRSIEIIRHRTQRYPTSHTCGSFFRNFYEHEVTITSNNKKMIYVAYYLDKIGIKGQLSVGDAIVSYQHANMIVNQGNATSHDIITLAQTMQKLVFENFGITPQPECQFLGFEKINN